MITRRRFLKNFILGSAATLLPLGYNSWAFATPNPSQNKLIVILMRGAVDGLSIVSPYMEPRYYHSRPTIALPPPNRQDGLIDLDGFFGLHPSLSALTPLWQNKTLAFVHASGSPAETRSHFEAQDILETAMLNSAMAQGGWLNNLAGVLPDNHSSTRALSFGDTLPKIFQGRTNIATVPTGIKGNKFAKAENPQTEQAFSQLYGNHSELGSLYQQGISARENMMSDLQDEMENSAKGAPGADAFTAQATKVATIIQRDPNTQLVFMDVGGWDTHVGQGNFKGQLAGKLEKLGEALSSLVTGLGPAYKNTAILVMSEFGRTVAENGNGGTDHGHGNVAWLLGGAVNGGKVWGRWPGLDENNLYQRRDLAVTTDFRSVIGAVLTNQFGLSDARMASVIPSYTPDDSLKGIIT